VGSQGAPFLTLEHTRDVIRADSARTACTIVVNVKGGTYRLSAPLVLDSRDSGETNAPVVYQAAAGETPIISGSKQVTNWTLHDPHLNIWQSQVTIDTKSMPRQLYVNEKRATRARTADYPNYYTPTTTGFSYRYLFGSDPKFPPVWNNLQDVEAVTATQWKMMRCPVAEVVNSTELIMQNPCWNNVSVFPEPWNFHLLSWLENAYEFLDEPGEWYLDSSSQILYYIPRNGEDMATAAVELPVLETLIRGEGSASAPVKYVEFRGLTFSYATWLGPSTADGYATDQSGFHLVGPDHKSNIIGHDPDVVRTPGNVSFSYAQNITFEGSSFKHLGAVALDFGTGSQNVLIRNNSFSDISSAGIQLGGVQAQDHHPTSPAELTHDNTISNNLIEYTGQEFYDAAGIYIGFTTRSLVEHNDIQHVPWSGIAIGWGWGLLDPGGFAGLPHATPYEWGVFTAPSAARGNRIVHNHIQYYLEKLWDGGAIYSTGFQGTSLEDGQFIGWNVAEHKRALAGGNIFYTDGGSRYITLHQNVSLNNPVGYMDFGPCLKGSSFEILCLLTDILSYGKDLGGCVPYGDLVFEENYLLDPADFYNICSNPYFPDVPTDTSYIDNKKVSSSSEVPASILGSAGRQ
jgi:GH141 insertion domain/Right handed beta helix region